MQVHVLATIPFHLRLCNPLDEVLFWSEVPKGEDCIVIDYEGVRAGGKQRKRPFCVVKWKADKGSLSGCAGTLSWHASFDAAKRAATQRAIG